MTRDELSEIRSRAQSGNVIFRSSTILKLLSDIDRLTAEIKQLEAEVERLRLIQYAAEEVTDEA